MIIRKFKFKKIKKRVGVYDRKFQKKSKNKLTATLNFVSSFSETNSEIGQG